jgi:cAMP-dependent protein kinase regulator
MQLLGKLYDILSRKRESYETVLKGIDILSSMDPYERTHVCDGLISEHFSAGDVVIKEVFNSKYIPLG